MLVMYTKKYYQLAKNTLFPICRSLTGSGTEKTLKIIKKEFPKLKIHKVSSGTKVFDWRVPPEWNVVDGYILDKNGEKIVDFKNNNLHLVGYSIPINKSFTKKYCLSIFTLCLNSPLQFHTLLHIIKNIGGFV